LLLIDAATLWRHAVSYTKNSMSLSTPRVYLPSKFLTIKRRCDFGFCKYQFL